MKMVIFHGYVNVYWRYDEFLTWESTEIRAGPCEAGTSVGLLAGSKWWTIHLGPTEAEAANRSSDHVRSPRVRQLESPCVFFTAKIDGIHGGGWWFIPKESGTVLLWEVWIILDIFGSIFIRWRVVLSQHENSRTIRSFASHELYVTCHLGSATHGQFAMLHSVWIETS